MQLESRYKIGTGKDTTKAIVRPPYEPVMTINPVQEEFLFLPEPLAGNLILNASTNEGYCYPGDTLRIILRADGMNRAITLANGFSNKNSFVINAFEKRYMQFVFDGFDWIMA